MTIKQPMFAAITALIAVLPTLIASAPAATSVTTTFDGGNTQGWLGTGGFGGATVVDFNDGTPAPSFRTAFPDFAIFGIEFNNDSNPDYLGDYTHLPFTISVDAKTRLVGLFLPGSRDLVLELRDYDNPPNGYPYVSVYYDLGLLQDPGAGGSGNWEHYSVTVNDPTQMTLPPGWGGTGDEDPMTFEPRLPADRTFASVLSGVDEIAFTTFKPGFFYINNYFDVAVDNIRVEFVPEPGTLGVFGGLGLLAWSRRRVCVCTPHGS